MQVRQIRFKAASGASPRDLAREFNLGVEQVRRILRYEVWRDVGLEGPGASGPEWEESVARKAKESAAKFEAMLKAEGFVPLSEEERAAAAFAKLDEEVARARRPAALLAEVQNLIDTLGTGGVDSGDGGQSPASGGEKK